MISGGGGEIYGVTQATFGKNILSIQASALSYLPDKIGNGTVGAGATTFMGNLSLPHFGWVAGFVESAVGHNVSVPWATVRRSPTMARRRSRNRPGARDGERRRVIVNLTVPPGSMGRSTSRAPDYNSTSASGFSINQSATTSVSVLLKKALGRTDPVGMDPGTVGTTPSSSRSPLAVGRRHEPVRGDRQPDHDERHRPLLHGRARRALRQREHQPDRLHRELYLGLGGVRSPPSTAQTREPDRGRDRGGVRRSRIRRVCRWPSPT